MRVRALPLRDAWFQPWSWTAGALKMNQCAQQRRRLDLISNVGGGGSWDAGCAAKFACRGRSRLVEGSHHAVGVGASLDGLWQVSDFIARPQPRVIEQQAMVRPPTSLVRPRRCSGRMQWARTIRISAGLGLEGVHTSDSQLVLVMVSQSIAADQTCRDG